MTRILADLPDDDVTWLDRRAAEEGRSRASMLREAVSAFKAQSDGSDEDWLKAGFGLWARHGIATDPHEYDRLRRAEWTRPWDDDYDAVRAESPECFADQDDRERAHYRRLDDGGPAPADNP
ncbi:CopG family transcriptional regulator [Sphingomonas sp. Leaf412]|uniref:ribbon-helix-helix domain-containing protein n=1 Tax=Sphingomonas sp. Leaf412 TaxID=1736370 RepID=UPI00070166E7|nr:CopG family transcriptional regulator [Sphingomonas sp. Leaf412]KQT31879.1 CopG family transcriptional regulator [Sphingomonas sp. Leaf412]